MALVLADRVQDTTTTTGTGTVTLANAPPAGFQSFGTAIGNGNTTYYVINGGSEWEVGVGTYTAAGTSLSRDTVLSSSNGGSLVNFSAGTKLVFVTYPSEKSVNKDVAGNVNVSITGNAATATKATNLNDGTAGAIPYQSASNVTAFLASASGVLVGGNPPTFSTTPTLTGTNFTAIPNAALSNSSVTIGSTSVALGATSATLAGLTSVTLTQDPTLALQAATKQYVDTVASTGIHFHQPVVVEAPANLTATYNNGTAGVGATLTNAGAQAALVIDGVTLNVADRVLIYQQTTQTQNGIYVVTSVGSVSTNWVLTRSSDANTFVSASPTGLSEGSTVFVQQGTTGAGTTYTCNTPGTITFGTTNITFAEISSAQIYSAGTGLTLTGTTFSLTTPVATTLGGTGLTTFGAINRAIFSSGTTTLTAGTLPVAAGGTGQTTFTDGQLLIGKTSDGSLAKATITAGTSISVTNGDGSITIANTAPDQVVSLTGSGTTTITGSYPNFNIASADQFVGTVTSVSASVDTTGTDIAVAVTNSTTTPAIALSIPTSSASARGALTSTDWSTFNGKQAALVSGTNIKTINGTSVLGSGDIVTPAGGSQTFTAFGAITAGASVAFKSTGVVEAITQVNTNAVTSGPVSPVASTYGEFILPSSVYDAANNRYIMAYVNSSGVGFVVAGVVTNGTLAWGTPVSLGSSTCYGVGLAYSAAQSKVVLAYNINSTLSVASLAGTGTTVSLNTATTLTTFNSSNIQPFAICYSATNNNVSILFYDSNSNVLTAIALTPSGSTISAGSANTLLSSYSQYGVRDFRLAPNTSGNTLLFLSLSSDRGTMRGINIYPSGTSFSNGSVFNPVNVGVYNAISLGSVSVEPRGGYFVFSWADNYYNYAQQISSISIGGSSVNTTLNTTSTVGYSSSNPANLAFFYDATANLTRTFTINQNNGLYSIGNVLTGSGTISFSVGTGLFSPGVSSGNKTGIFNSDGTWFTSNTPIGGAINAWSFTPATSTSNFLSYIGISTQTVTDGQSVVVTTGGGVNTNVSGLTAGLTYAVSATGALLASSTNFPRAGRALTTTSILVEDRAALTAATKTWTQITSTSTYTVPSGISSIRVYAFGGGGNGFQDSYNGRGGGGGGCAFGDLSVVPGQALSISISSKNVTITRSGVTLFTANAGTDGAAYSGGIGGDATISGLISNGGAYSGGNGAASGGGGGSSGSPLGDGRNGGVTSGGGGGWGGTGGGGGSSGNGSGGGGGGVGGSGSTGANYLGGGGGGSGGNASGYLGGAARSPLIAFTDPLLVEVSSEGASGGPFGVTAGNGGGGSGQGSRTDNGAGIGGSGGFGGGGGGATAGSGTSAGGSGGFGGGGGGVYNNYSYAQGGSGGFGGGGGGASSLGGANGGSGGSAIVLIYA